MNSLLIFPMLGMFLGTLFADEKKAPAHELSEWKFGRTLSGDVVTPASLGGKVVVLEYWGVKCETCVKSIARLSELDRELRDQGLRVVGGEVYRSGMEQIEKVVRSEKVGFTITDGLMGPISISSLPHVVVFGGDGKMVFSGHPGDAVFEKRVRESLNASPKKVQAVLAAATHKGFLVPKRTWKSQEGEPLLAAVVRLEGKKVIFKLEDGREIFYEVSKLSEADWRLIKKSLVGGPRL